MIDEPSSRVRPVRAEAARHLSRDELAAGLDEILRSPRERGALRAVVIRPQTDARELLQRCELSPERGVHGDNWALGCWMTLPDGRPHPDVQVTLMNARTIALIAQDEARWPLAGDNLYVDLDLSAANLPPGTRLAIGSALLEITAVPHNGCAKFAAALRRRGDALRQLARGQAPAPARDLRPDRPTGRNHGRRPGDQALAGCGNKVVAGLISTLGGGEWACGERVGVLRAAVWPGFRALGAELGHDQPAASSLGRRTRLQAAAVSVNSQPTRAVPRWRVLRRPPTVLIQPKPSSIRLRRRWLVA